ncbi:MAG: FAD-binding protein [Desulfobacterales bacterium]|nr:FAD-binding protein [Desulfobacterales bacterium]
MVHFVDITVAPKFIYDKAYLSRRILEKHPHVGEHYRIIKRSVDARRNPPHFVLRIEINPKRQNAADKPMFRFEPVAPTPRVIIVGAGPAGYFAALALIENGIKPIVLEQGENVRARRKRIAGILRDGTIDPNSNYCFGEGGAGTFSDGKLYTRATKRGDAGKILQLLVYHGASEDILIDAHPHIGSNKLPAVVQRIRETITTCGGEVHFNARVTDFILNEGAVTGVRLSDGNQVTADAVILAAGHSARDLYQWFHDRGFLIEAKPLAIGVRVEHPQALIDAAQYHHHPRHSNLPAATYRLACQYEDRGIYSFCMCPGGYIVPTATGPCELAVNGMSFSGRKGPFANAGMVVEVLPEDIQADHAKGPLSVLAFQRALEAKAFRMGGGNGQRAPAQRMTDFIKSKLSDRLPTSSYLPGIASAPLHELLPPFVTRRLAAAFDIFNRKLKGFLTEEALLIAVESRTSSPVRIPRNAGNLMHSQLFRLFPCGEGAGYAGGIVSSAMDGQRVAKQVADFINNIN